MANPPNFKITVDKLNDLLEATKLLTQTEVMVGIPSVNAGRKDTPINNATIGYIHEHGAPEANIPARPWLGPGVEAAKDQLTKIFREAGKAAYNGRQDLVIRQLNVAGLTAQVSVQKKLREGPFVPLAPATIARRRARGVTRTKPLIDTGQLLQSVTYVLRKR